MTGRVVPRTKHDEEIGERNARDINIGDVNYGISIIVLQQARKVSGFLGQEVRRDPKECLLDLIRRQPGCLIINSERNT
jgi:hypothetical protein